MLAVSQRLPRLAMALSIVAQKNALPMMRAGNQWPYLAQAWHNWQRKGIIENPLIGTGAITGKTRSPMVIRKSDVHIRNSFLAKYV